MAAFHEAMQEYKQLLQKGALQTAYRGLMEYMLGLKTYLKKEYPDYIVPGSLYQGYMDMTYFAFTPPSIAARKLKIALVFVHPAFRFEVWLAGANRQVQAEYWRLFKERGWDAYRLVPSIQGVDAIVEHILVADPDFRDLEALTEQIERETLMFIAAVESFLTEQQI